MEAVKAGQMDGIVQKGSQNIPEDRSARYRPLYAAQRGEEYPSVSTLKGFGGRSVLEIIALDDSGTYRAVYTVRFEEAIYVLHAFQKKSKKGISTPQQEIELIKRRLAAAEREHRARNN